MKARPSLPRLAPLTLPFLLLGLLLSTAATVRAQNLGQARRDMLEMLDTTAKEIERSFYDPKLKGLDWAAAQQQARERIQQAQNVNQMLAAVFLFVQQLEDSHTVLIPPDRVAEVRFGFEAKAFGDEVFVYELREDGAAKAAGLQLGDRVLAINGVRVERGNIDLLLLALRRLLPVTTLELAIARGEQPPQVIRIEAQIKQRRAVRDWREVETIWQLIREMEGEKTYFHYSAHPSGVGYVQLPNFKSDKPFLRDLLKEIRGSRAVIIDLRSNPGGVVDTVADFAGFFESQPTVMAELVGRKKTDPIKVKPSQPNFSGPLFVLVDSRSASASELLARHFQLTGRGVIIGDRTAGRLTAARIFPEAIAGGTISFSVQIADARVVFPGGEEVEKRGVAPDHLCIPTQEDVREERDPCRDLALGMAMKALGIQEKAPEDKPKSEK